MIKFSQLPEIINGNLRHLAHDHAINYIFTDSRKVISHDQALFFARQGPHHDGHFFLSQMYDAGIRNFVIEKPVNTSRYKDANFVQVRSSLEALQELVKYHREQLALKVIGITGSNGKTIIKEWLHQLLSGKHRVIATPHSYNSQLGVPLSVWQANENHELGIFEAGISQPDEMDRLERIIQPDIGLFTNIGPAHQESFPTREAKIEEKLKLFKNCRILIYCSDHTDIKEALTKSNPSFETFTWGKSHGSNLVIEEKKVEKEQIYIKLAEDGVKHDLCLPVREDASFENLMHCIAVMRLLKYEWQEINNRIKGIRRIPMRLELKRGVNNCYIIDDSYNNDLAGLGIALNFLSQHKQRNKKSVIISDIFQSGMEEKLLYEEVNKLLEQKNIDRIYAIGPVISSWKELFTIPVETFPDTNIFLKNISPEQFKDEMILVKGARMYAFERIVNRLLEKIHGTRLEINLGAITHNLNFYRSRLKKETKVMVMVKAFAYGSGMHEIANLLQYHNVDYLGVAYTDEGVNLRKNGIEIPIMIMNPSPEGFEQLIKFNLEPVIYGFDQLDNIVNFLGENELNIHLKIDTGMHRLGFQEKDLDYFIQRFKKIKNLHIKSIFSHLAAADDLEHRNFTKNQAENFEQVSSKIISELNIKPLRHLLNSAGAINYPEHQFDMIRLGIGLYGVEASGLLQDKLQPISTLKSIVSQVRDVPKGRTIGYGRMGKAEEDKKIATVAIGYADGFTRFFSNGKGEMLVNGARASVIGNVCMDMTMIDVTGMEVKEGDDVIIFGEEPTINELAARIGTIPYEILTNVSERVKRVYLYD
ncbi:MAG: bifunctional UDP-N-acetylmuramoyl-tripeptide:D-alanyl-D-alanine ligase/alanine racemase [Candidatus Cyclobacteriaceae bacterium M2_1C_046]